MEEHKTEQVDKKTENPLVIKKNGNLFWKVTTVVLVVVLAVFAFRNNGGSDGATGGVVAPSLGGLGGGPSPVVDMEKLADDDPFMGDENAPVVMIEWSDYECPFCSRFFQQTLPLLKKDYIDTGKVKFVYRDFPLSFHDPIATKEAIAANCAREQGKDAAYFKYHDEIFKRTTSNGNGLAVADLYAIASDLGLNSGNFKSCLDSNKYNDEVQKDIRDGSAVGIQGTPGFIINGKIVSGAQPFSVFQQVIDAELN